jgi:hypothetical protein
MKEPTAKMPPKGTTGMAERDFFYKKIVFACVCAFFFVSLHDFSYYA